MVDAVLKNLPKEWNGVIIMDWSNGFWDKMKKKHNNLVEKLMKSKKPDNKSLKLTHPRSVVMGNLVFHYNEFHIK
jgi:hypothetical protein